MRRYSGSPSDGYTFRPPAFASKTQRACWSTHGPVGARAACGAPDRAGAEALILQTIEDTRAAGGTGRVWYMGDAISPPFMDDALAQHGYEKTEDLDILAFELGTGPEPHLPDLRVPHDVTQDLRSGQPAGVTRRRHP